MSIKELNQETLNKQNNHWNTNYNERNEMFGKSPSVSAIKAVQIFNDEGVKHILELGSGQGRDTMYFAQNGIKVDALDYSDKGIAAITKNAQTAGLIGYINGKCHDVRMPLPFEDETFDACYSHMLFCMALKSVELENLSNDIWRVLKPGGLNIYTVRNTNDAHYGQGIHRGEDMYENNGFIVHFFSKEKIKHLSKGYEIIGIHDFEEGELPRKISSIIMKKL